MLKHLRQTYDLAELRERYSDYRFDAERKLVIDAAIDEVVPYQVRRGYPYYQLANRETAEFDWISAWAVFGVDGCNPRLNPPLHDHPLSAAEIGHLHWESGSVLNARSGRWMTVLNGAVATRNRSGNPVSVPTKVIRGETKLVDTPTGAMWVPTHIEEPFLRGHGIGGYGHLLAFKDAVFTDRWYTPISTPIKLPSHSTHVLAYGYEGRPLPLMWDELSHLDQAPLQALRVCS